MRMTTKLRRKASLTSSDMFSLLSQLEISDHTDDNYNNLLKINQCQIVKKKITDY